MATIRIGLARGRMTRAAGPAPGTGVFGSETIYLGRQANTLVTIGYCRRRGDAARRRSDLAGMETIPHEKCLTNTAKSFRIKPKP